MNSNALLLEAFGRLEPLVRSACDGLSGSQLEFRPDSEANSIGWLIWHLTRVQDDHVADLAQTRQIWFEQGWHERFGLDLDAQDTGYGYSPDQVGQVRGLTPDLLLGYFADTAGHTELVLRTLDDSALDRIVDTSWDPPVTAGVRLVSVLGDCLEHVGQAAYVRGLVERRDR